MSQNLENITYKNNSIHGSEHIYTNNRKETRSFLITIQSGEGGTSPNKFDSGGHRYWAAGTRGNEVQLYINNVLQHSVNGGDGASQKYIESQYISHYRRRRCGRHWWGGVKWCNDVPVYAWRNLVSKPNRAGSPSTKSLIVNLKYRETIKIKFVGNGNIHGTRNNGIATISELPLYQDRLEDFIFWIHQIDDPDIKTISIN